MIKETPPESAKPQGSEALLEAFARQLFSQTGQGQQGVSGFGAMGQFLRPADFNKFSPEELRAVTSTLGIEDERALAERRLAQGEAGANTPGPEGIQAGGVYQAAHPMQFVAQLANQGAAAFDRYQGRKGVRDARAQEQAGAQAMIRALRRPGGEEAATKLAGYKTLFDYIDQGSPVFRGKYQTDADSFADALRRGF